MLIQLRDRRGNVVGQARVDDEDYERVNAQKWHMSRGYANTTINLKNVLMHHFVYKRPEKGMVIDHINGDKLDNRKCNLRETTHAGNTNNVAHADKTKTSSQYIGVRRKTNDKFEARYDDIQLYYGDDERQAAILYDVCTYQKFGEHARNNKLITHEEAMQMELPPKKDKKVRDLPDNICLMNKNKCFRVRITHRKNQYVYYFTTLEAAKRKLDDINAFVEALVELEHIWHNFQDIDRNKDGIAVIPYKHHEILVSDDDWHDLKKIRWYVCRGTGYAFNNDLQTMHALLMPCEKGMVVNHVNGNRLDNRRENLEVATVSENAHMRRFKKEGAHSRYFGVTWHKPLNKWAARIKKDHKAHYLGVYEVEEDAARAYNAKAVELYGDRANLNIILEN